MFPSSSETNQIAIALKHLKPGSPTRKQVYFLDLNLKILSWLLVSRFRIQVVELHAKKAVAKAIFHFCKQADVKSSKTPKLDSKSIFVHCIYLKTKQKSIC